MSTDSTYAVYTRLPSLLVHLARRAEHHAERARGHDDRTTGEGGLLPEEDAGDGTLPLRSGSERFSGAKS